MHNKNKWRKNCGLQFVVFRPLNKEYHAHLSPYREFCRCKDKESQPSLGKISECHRHRQKRRVSSLKSSQRFPSLSTRDPAAALGFLVGLWSILARPSLPASRPFEPVLICATYCVTKKPLRSSRCLYAIVFIFISLLGKKGLLTGTHRVPVF